MLLYISRQEGMLIFIGVTLFFSAIIWLLFGSIFKHAKTPKNLLVSPTKFDFISLNALISLAVSLIVYAILRNKVAFIIRLVEKNPINVVILILCLFILLSFIGGIGIDIYLTINNKEFRNYWENKQDKKKF